MDSRLIPAMSIFLLAGCGLADSVDPPQQYAFDGTFAPLTEDFPELGGTVAAITQDETTVSFNVHGLEPQADMMWKLTEGSCDAPGAPVVDPEAFSPLTTDETGRLVTGEGGTDLPGGPGEDEPDDPPPNPVFFAQLSPDSTYAVLLFEGDTTEDQEPIACADLGDGEDPTTSNGAGN